jgi:hypothetical protein
MKFNITWFRNGIEEAFSDYTVTHRYFPESDFGTLDQVGFESDKKGGQIDFYSNDVLHIHIFDYTLDKEIFVILLGPDQEIEKLEAIKKMLKLIS